MCCSVLQCVAVIRRRREKAALRRVVLRCLLRSITVCCGVSQCVAVRCSVLQCAAHIAVCCSVLQCAARIAVCCSVLQCGNMRSAEVFVAVCCSVLQCNAVCCSVLQCAARIAVCCREYVSPRNCGIEANSADICVAVCCSLFQCVAVNRRRRVSPAFFLRQKCWGVSFLVAAGIL